MVASLEGITEGLQQHILLTVGSVQLRVVWHTKLWNDLMPIVRAVASLKGWI